MQQNACGSYTPLLSRVDNCLLTVKVFSRDVQLKFSSTKKPPYGYAPVSKRSSIIRFSKRSAKRLRHVIRNSEDKWKAFITLTYPASFPCDGRETKEHLNSFLQFLRRKGIRYTWVLEFQERGAPHYHIIVSDYVARNELFERWYKIVGSQDEKHLRAGTQIQSIKSKSHLYGYLSNYIKKLNQKTPPDGFENVGRFWGTSRNLLAHEVYKHIDHYFKLALMTKLMRKWYKAHLRNFGIKWKWKGQGLTVMDGASIMNQLCSLKC